MQEKDQIKKHELESEYREKDKNVKKKARRDKCIFIDKLANSPEEAAQKGDLRTLYNITKKLAADYGRGDERPVKDKAGHTILNDEEQVRWAEHFREILNRSPPEEITNFSVLEKMEPIPIIGAVIDIEEG